MQQFWPLEYGSLWCNAVEVQQKWKDEKNPIVNRCGDLPAIATERDILW